MESGDRSSAISIEKEENIFSSSSEVNSEKPPYRRLGTLRPEGSSGGSGGPVRLRGIRPHPDLNLSSGMKKVQWTLGWR